MKLDKRHKWGEGKAVWVDKPYRMIAKFVYTCRVCGKKTECPTMDYAMSMALKRCRRMITANIFKRNRSLSRLIKSWGHTNHV